MIFSLFCTCGFFGGCFLFQKGCLSSPVQSNTIYWGGWRCFFSLYFIMLPMFFCWTAGWICVHMLVKILYVAIEQIEEYRLSSLWACKWRKTKKRKLKCCAWSSSQKCFNFVPLSCVSFWRGTKFKLCELSFVAVLWCLHNTKCF